MRTRTRPIGLLAVTLICALLPWSAETSAYEYVEDFMSLEYCDVGETKALWDTTDGMIRLHMRQPQIVGSYQTPGPANAVLVDGDYVYVAANDVGGLQIVDITDPTNPGLVGSCLTDGSAIALALWGDYIFVADGMSGLAVVDISDPTVPAVVGTTSTLRIALDERLGSRSVLSMKINPLYDFIRDDPRFIEMLKEANL